MAMLPEDFCVGYRLWCRRAWVCLLLFFLSAGTSTVWGQGWSAEVFAGTSWSLPTPLRIEQPGEPSIRFRARYKTKPWQGSPYYAYRVGYQQWTAELVHHKLYLQNPTSEIEHFEVSHGYNLAMISRAITPPSASTIFRLGLGLVIGHPEGRIRGKAVNPVRSFLGGGYHVSGLSLQLAVGRELSVYEGFFIKPEAKLTAAWARMPLAGGGFAQVPNVAVHTLLGFGYRTKER